MAYQGFIDSCGNTGHLLDGIFIYYNHTLWVARRIKDVNLAVWKPHPLLTKRQFLKMLAFSTSPKDKIVTRIVTRMHQWWKKITFMGRFIRPHPPAKEFLEVRVTTFSSKMSPNDNNYYLVYVFPYRHISKKIIITPKIDIYIYKLIFFFFFVILRYGKT